MDPSGWNAQDEPLPERIAHGLARISIALRHRAWQEGNQQGLTPTQGQVLAFLRFRPGNMASVAAIADALAVTLPTASDAVSALEAKGLITRRRSTTDRRQRIVALTPAGQQAAEVVASWPDFLSTAITELTPDEQQVLWRLLLKVIRTLQERGEIPVAQMCLTCRYFRPFAHTDPKRPHHCAYVDAPFGDGSLRLDCPDYQRADPDLAELNWQTFCQRR
ncbi:MAG: winged helix-turn-helix transcriptional regulator [Thermorudis peleae]|nr:winged helix-turn-helix transcriptional regulator [Thermorudis peleae]